METQLQISVCIPMYNSSPYLRECIDSVLNQTYENFELLIVDDGSSDNSTDIIKSYQDSRIRLFKNKHNFIESLNLLLTEAKGKYIARMDADDIMMPDRLKLQLAFMESHPNIDILGGGIQCIGDNNDIIIPYYKDVMPIAMFTEGNPIANPTTMMRRSSISNMKYYKQFIYAEDYHFWYQALKNGLKIMNIKNIVIKYRVTPTQVSNIQHNRQIKAAKLVMKKFSWLATEKEAKYSIPLQSALPLSKKKLSVIITFLNEGEEVECTVKSIRQTIGDKVEIIVINDCSNDNYPYGETLLPYHIHYIVNRERMGVGASRDLGVKLCQTPYFILLDAHMRFYEKIWAGRIIEELEKNEKQLICCQTRFLSKDKNTGKTEIIKESPRTFGAYIPFNKNSIWPDIDWNLKEQKPKQKKENIPAVLGACYAASKQYWQYLKGLEGLKMYGSDEAFISLKVWLEGGKCLLLKDVEIGHIYRQIAPYSIINKDIIYNQLFIAKLLFPISVYCKTAITAIQKNQILALQVIKEIKHQNAKINEIKKYFKTIFTRNIKEIFQYHKTYYKYNNKNQPQYDLKEITLYLKNNIPNDNGIFEGKTGYILWLCIYARTIQESTLEDFAVTLYRQVESAVEKQQLPWNFGYGLSGIGWGILYLWFNKMLDNYPDTIISSIDEQLKCIDPIHIHNSSFQTGAVGIIAYLSLRLSVGLINWPTELLKKWEQKAKDIIEKTTDSTCLYFSFLFLTIRKEAEGCEPMPLLNSWLNSPTHFPLKKEYWKYTLYDGILGHTIQTITY